MINSYYEIGYEVKGVKREKESLVSLYTNESRRKAEEVRDIYLYIIRRILREASNKELFLKK